MPKNSLFKQTTRTDPDTAAALSIVDMEQKQELLKKTEQERRELLIAQCHEVVGRVQANQLMAKFGNVASLVYLQQVKKSKIYKDLPGIGTWDKFCNYIGLARRKVDEDLLNLAAFGEEFLETCCQLSVGYRDLKKLRMMTKDGDLVIDAEYAVIGDERIPLSPDHTEDLQAAIETLLENRDKKIDDQAATIKAKDRLLETKEKLINKQEKSLAILEQRAAARGMSAEEEAFLQQCENAQITIDGFLAQFDPDLNPPPDNPTPRMRAALMETLGYFRRVIDATFDTASERYGNPDLDDDWVPPHLRPQDSETPDCSTCDHKKAMSNPKRGRKIPGQHGKCTRPEGLCFEPSTTSTEE